MIPLLPTAIALVAGWARLANPASGTADSPAPQKEAGRRRAAVVVAPGECCPTATPSTANPVATASS